MTVVHNKSITEYQSSKQLSFRKHIETYTLDKIAGSFHGLRVLDLACGNGFYTRKIKEKGAAITIGIDVAAEMIQLAEANETAHPVGCHYRVQNAAEMPRIGTFDMVTAMYLLNHAKSKEELVQFCKTAYAHLAIGGRFIGCNDNIYNEPEHHSSYQKYGFSKYCTPERKDGDPITYVMHNPDGSQFQFNNYYLSPQTYQEAFEEAGFVDFRWEGPYLNPDQQDNSFWTPFMDAPPIIGFSAYKRYREI